MNVTPAITTTVPITAPGLFATQVAAAESAWPTDCAAQALRQATYTVMQPG